MKKIYFILFYFLFIVLIVNACTKQQETHQIVQKPVRAVSSEDVSRLTPEEVVVLYFQAWDDKQYEVMYSLVSEGFKQIEPTANTLDDFELYINSFFETEKGINVIEAKEAYSTDTEAGVNYKIEIIRKDGAKREFSNAYTLKKRANGWKMIHPYGENIDTS